MRKRGVEFYDQRKLTKNDLVILSYLSENDNATTVALAREHYARYCTPRALKDAWRSTYHALKRLERLKMVEREDGLVFPRWRITALGMQSLARGRYEIQPVTASVDEFLLTSVSEDVDT
jgi:hypothetical protein